MMGSVKSGPLRSSGEHIHHTRWQTRSVAVGRASPGSRERRLCCPVFPCPAYALTSSANASRYGRNQPRRQTFLHPSVRTTWIDFFPISLHG